MWIHNYLHQKFGFTIDEKHKCENVWKRFIKTANIKLDEDSIKKDSAFIPSIEPKVTSANIPTNQING